MSTDKIVKVSISFPQKVLDRIDQQASDWHTTRSATVLRAWLEWEATQEETQQETPLTPIQEAA